MTDDRVWRRWCAVIQLRDGRVQSLTENVPILIKMIERWSNNDYVQLLRSSDGTLFSVLFRSNKPAQMLSAEFESCSGSLHGDTFIVFEVGDECSNSTGFQRPLAWIQHR